MSELSTEVASFLGSMTPRRYDTGINSDLRIGLSTRVFKAAAE